MGVAVPRVPVGTRSPEPPQKHGFEHVKVILHNWDNWDQIWAWLIFLKVPGCPRLNFLWLVR